MYPRYPLVGRLGTDGPQQSRDYSNTRKKKEEVENLEFVRPLYPPEVH